MWQFNKPEKSGVQKSIYLLIFILFISLTCVCVSALKFEGIHGIIHDGESNPVPGATVALYASNGKFIDYALSMDDGSFCFHVEDGVYFIVASKGRFSTRSEIFRYNRTNGKRIDLILNPSVGVMDLLERIWFFIAPIFGFVCGFLLEVVRNSWKRKNLKRVILYSYGYSVYEFLDRVEKVNDSITGNKVNETATDLKEKISNVEKKISTINKNYGGSLSVLDPKFLIDVIKKKNAIEDLEEFFSCYEHEPSRLISFLKDHNRHEWEGEPENHDKFDKLLVHLKPKESLF